MLTEKTEPYELLVRWKGSQISGAHYGEIKYILDGAEVVSHTVLPVVPIDAINPVLTAIFTADQLDAIKARAELTDAQGQIEQMNTTITSLTSTCDAIQNELSLTQAQLVIAQARIEELLNPPPEKPEEP